jgi:hypothetical protein
MKYSEFSEWKIGETKNDCAGEDEQQFTKQTDYFFSELLV